jgi:hypothetical protein
MPMRWVTRETLAGGLSADEEEEREQQWMAARRSIRPLLHSGAEVLIEVNMHDGVIDSLRQVESNVVELRALIGDLQDGYKWLHARYQGALLKIIDPGFESEISGAYEILRDELSVQDALFTHSVITWPHGEFDIDFTSVTVGLSPAGNHERARFFAK